VKKEIFRRSKIIPPRNREIKTQWTNRKTININEKERQVCRDMNFYLLLLYLLGIVPLVIGLRHLKRSLNQNSWNETEGRITQSEIIRPQPGYKGVVTPLIRYEYQVGSQKYNSNQVNQDNFTLGIEFGVKSILRRYPYDHKVKVFYNPDHPEQSVLERRITVGTYLWLAIGISLLCTISYGLKYWN
jgi:hypothetical protein